MFNGVEVVTTDVISVVLELEDSELLELFDRGPVGSTETALEATNVDDVHELLTDKLTPRDVEAPNHVLDAVLDMLVDVVLTKTVEGAPGNNAGLLVVSRDKELKGIEPAIPELGRLDDCKKLRELEVELVKDTKNRLESMELLLVEVFNAASVVVKDRGAVSEALVKLDEDDVLCEAVRVSEPPRFVVIVAGG